MAKDFLLLSPEYLEASGAAVDASSSATATGMPWSNLFDHHAWKKVRTSSLTGMSLILDLGQARDIDTVLLLYSNARAATDWRIRLADTEGGLTSATGDDDSGTVDFWPASTPSTAADDWPHGTHGLWRPASTRTRRWMQFDFTDATHPDGYLEFGCLIVAEAFKPAKTAAYGSRPPSEQEQPVRVRSQSGHAYAVPGPRPTMASYKLNSLTEAEYQALRRIYRLRGTSLHVATVFDPTDTANLYQNIVHGFLADNSPISRPKYLASGAEWVAEVAIESATG